MELICLFLTIFKHSFDNKKLVSQSVCISFWVFKLRCGNSNDFVSLEWINGVDGSAKVSLLTGTNAATMKPTGYSFTINGADGEYDWKVRLHRVEYPKQDIQMLHRNYKGAKTFAVIFCRFPLISLKMLPSLFKSVTLTLTLRTRNYRLWSDRKLQ